MGDLMAISDIRKEFNLHKGEEFTWFKYLNIEIIRIGKRLYCNKFDYPKIKEFYTQPNLNEIKSQLICQKRKQTNLKKYGGFSPMASKKVRNKIKETCLKKYGETSILKVKKVRNKIKETKFQRYGNENFNNINKIKETCLKKYGVESITQSEDFKNKSKITKLQRYNDENFNNRDKAKETCLKKYGVENITQSDFIKEKSKETCLKKYGTEYQWQSENMRRKTKETCLKKYGVEHPSQIDFVKEKVKQTNLKKFGVEHPMQSNEILRKSHKKWKVNNINDISFASKEEAYFYCYLKDNNKKFEYQIEYPEQYKDKLNKYHTFIVDFKFENKYFEIKGSQFFDSNNNAVIIYDKNGNNYEKRLSLWESKLDFINKHDDIILINTKEFKKTGKYFYMKEYFIQKYEFIKNY